MQKGLLMIGAGALIIAAGVYYSVIRGPGDSAIMIEDQAAIQQMLTEFGKKLKEVPLLANTNDRRAQMDAVYSPYVAPELLASWYPEGAEALGRYSSNPYPDIINIVEIIPSGAHYRVEANIVERTSDHPEEAAAVQPITLELEKRDGRWLITKMQKGAYSSIPHTEVVVGFLECLPHRNATGPVTGECSLGIARDQSDGHVALDLQFMEVRTLDLPMGTKVRATGTFTPANNLSSEQVYDIDGVMSAKSIETIQ